MATWTEKVLNISTANIPKHTAEALGTSNDYDSKIAVFEACISADLWDKLSYTPWACYGWIIWAGHETDEIKEEHPQLANLMEYATSKGFTYLKLDCDAEELPGFERFEW